MKSKIVPLLCAGVMLGFNPASGAGEKYIKIDPDSGKPDYISKEDAAKVTGMPEDSKLCEITFKNVKIPKVVNGENENVNGYEFDCKPAKECNESNKRDEKEKAIDQEIKKQEAEAKEQQKEIDRQNKIINPPAPAKGQPTPKPPTTEEKKKAGEEKKKAQGEKKKAEEEIEKLKARLAKFERAECALKYFVGAGGKEPGAKEHRFTPDQIKERKIEHVICTCESAAGP